MKVIENHKDYVIVEDTLVNGENIYLMPPSEYIPTLQDAAIKGRENIEVWAKEFIANNKELFNRLSKL